MESLDELMKPELIWFLVGIVLLILEFSIPGLLIFFFGVGACIVATLCMIFDLSLNIQLTVFLLSSGILLLSLRKWMKKIFMGKVTTANVEFDDLEDDVIGRTVVVIAKITPEIPGIVEVNGTNWTATAKTTIKAGQPVKVIHKKNLTLTVKPL